MLFGIVVGLLGYIDFGILAFFIGLGFLVHHRIAEPHLKGIENFIYRKRG